MDPSHLAPMLADPARVDQIVRSLGIADVASGTAHAASIAKSVPPQSFEVLFSKFAELLPSSSDPDRVLNNLDRFITESNNPVATCEWLAHERDALTALVQLFSASQSLAEQLIHDPAALEQVCQTGGQPVARDLLVDQIVSEITSHTEERAVVAAMRQIKQRETLRIAFGDIIKRQSIDVVTRQISNLADAMIEAAVACAKRKLQGIDYARQEGRFAVLALGKLGGEELNYSSDIDLHFVYSAEWPDLKKRATGIEHFERLARQVVKYLSETTEQGMVFRVDMRLRPHGATGPLTMSFEETLHYYDVLGRTWQRQAFVKARAVAGDRELGRELLRQLEPWVYRRYLSRADITGIKALKRRIEQRAKREQTSDRDVKCGRGGLRDIEFVIQFLQLLNGGDLPEIRVTNTLEAIRQLQVARCLTEQESVLLTQNYEFLRNLEHRLQLLFDLQARCLPDDDVELRRLAIRMNYRDGATTALAQLKSDFAEKTAVNHKILNHLLHQAFPDDIEAEPEVDLVLDPAPPRQLMQDVLSPYGFRNVPEAYHNLIDLSTEKIAFLSTRRCRHFLAAIASRLLQAIAATPDPDFTLRNLSRVSESLGGKGVLWELFSFSKPTLQLYVRLCAVSPYLSDILVSNPGMIDELLDCLLLDKLPTLESLRTTLSQLCRGAEDVEPILNSFKSSMHLRVGVRDVLGKDDITATHHTLADIMEVILTKVAKREYQKLARRFGEPILADGPRGGQPCELIIVALGKLGGREPNYHSDCDVLFLYEGEGHTRFPGRAARETTTNAHFFGHLAQRIIKVVTQLGAHGRLFDVDARLRPTGNAGPLAMSLREFSRYYAEGFAQLWERQALCKARAIHGSPLARIKTMHLIRQAIVDVPWQPQFAEQMLQMRRKIELGASDSNLKRGPGGVVDIEFVVQMLQLKHAARTPAVLVPGTLPAIEALAGSGYLSRDEAAWWSQSYLYLRRVESALRLMNTTARHSLPTDLSELGRLGYLLGISPERLEGQCYDLMSENRKRFEQVLGAEFASALSVAR